MSNFQLVAYDILERRVYGTPGETHHRVLWIENYRLPDGTISGDLDYLLEAARNRDGGVDGSACTIHIKELYAVK